MVVNPACGQLNRGNEYSPSVFAPENLVSRDEFGSPVPRQPAHLHTQEEYGAYLRDSSRVARRRPFVYFKPPYAIGPVPSFSGHAIAYRWCSLPRVPIPYQFGPVPSFSGHAIAYRWCSLPRVPIPYQFNHFPPTCRGGVYHTNSTISTLPAVVGLTSSREAILPGVFESSILLCFASFWCSILESSAAVKSTTEPRVL